MKLRRSPVRHSSTRRRRRQLARSLSADERGATAAFVVVSMFVLLGMVALAVDIGMLLGARTDSQRVADAAALAGAASFISEPDNPDRPRQWAIDYAAKNTVHGTVADVHTEDVDVLLDERKVRVRVRNVVERGNAIRTVFAKVLGWDQVDISTVAAAEAQPAGEGMCPIPLALPDRWDDKNDDDLYDGPPEWYEPFPGGELPGQQDVHYTGYDLDDAAFGTLLEIKTRGGKADDGSGNSICASQDDASWRCWYQPEAVNGGPGGGGVDELRPWIRHCPDLDFTLHVGDRLYAASGSGNKQSLMHSDGVQPEDYDFGDLVREFPGVWEPGQPCPMVPVVDGDGNSTGARECAGPGNLRVRVMPVVSPDEVYKNGHGLYATVSQLVCVWIDKVAEHPTAEPSTVSGSPGRRNLYVRVYDGCGGDGEGTGEFLWKLRLVE